MYVNFVDLCLHLEFGLRVTDIVVELVLNLDSWSGAVRFVELNKNVDYWQSYSC